MRDIKIVIDKIVNEIPDEWPYAFMLKSEILGIRYQACYTAPEMHKQLWKNLSFELSRAMPDVKEFPWARKVSNIIRNKEEDNEKLV